MAPPSREVESCSRSTPVATFISRAGVERAFSNWSAKSRRVNWVPSAGGAGSPALPAAGGGGGRPRAPPRRRRQHPLGAGEVARRHAAGALDGEGELEREDLVLVELGAVDRQGQDEAGRRGDGGAAAGPVVQELVDLAHPVEQAPRLGRIEREELLRQQGGGHRVADAVGIGELIPEAGLHREV